MAMELERKTRAGMTEKKGKDKGRGRRDTPDLTQLAIGYGRVSTKGQGKSGVSLEAQRDAIQKFASDMHFELIDVCEEVASAVGAESFDKRPVLRKVLDVAVQRDALVLVWDWDRLTRHGEFNRQIREVLDDPEKIVCVRNGQTLRDAAENATLAHDQKVAERLSRSTKEGMERKRAEGVKFGNPAIKTDVQPKGTATWNAASEAQIRKIADLLRDRSDRDDLSSRQIAEILNAQGLRTLHGNTWNAQRVRSPVKKARALLEQEDEQAYRNNPLNGMF